MFVWCFWRSFSNYSISSVCLKGFLRFVCKRCLRLLDGLDFDLEYSTFSGLADSCRTFEIIRCLWHTRPGVGLPVHRISISEEDGLLASSGQGSALRPNAWHEQNIILSLPTTWESPFKVKEKREALQVWACKTSGKNNKTIGLYCWLFKYTVGLAGSIKKCQQNPKARRSVYFALFPENVRAFLLNLLAECLLYGVEWPSAARVWWRFDSVAYKLTKNTPTNDFVPGWSLFLSTRYIDIQNLNCPLFVSEIDSLEAASRQVVASTKNWLYQYGRSNSQRLTQQNYW